MIMGATTLSISGAHTPAASLTFAPPAVWPCRLAVPCGQMREYTSQLASRLEHLAAEQQRSTALRPATAGGADAGARNDEYRERYMRVRTEYRNLLRSRTDSVKRSGRVAAESEQGVLINQLDAALKDEAELHRKESQRLNEELYLQEKR